MIQYLKNNYYDKGGYRDILIIAIPLMGSMLSITFIEFTDKLLLGHYSIDSVAAVGPAAMAHLLFLITFNNIIGFIGIMIAQYIGAKSYSTVGVIFWQGFWISLLCTAILFGLSFISETLFVLTKQPPELIPLEKEYFDTLSMYSIVPLLNAVFIAFYSGQGKTVRISISIMIAAIVNIPLNYILIYGQYGFPELGIQGAAIATICAWFIELLILASGVFTKENREKFALMQGFCYNAPLFKRILIYGIPSGLYSFLELLGATIFLFLVGVLGKVEIATINVTFSLDLFGYLPIMGMSIALSIITGRSIGEKNPSVIYRTFTHSIQLMIIWRIVLSILFLLMPYTLFTLILGTKQSSELQQIMSYAPAMLGFCVINGIIDGVLLMFTAVLKGSGKTMFIMTNMFLCVLFIEILPMVLLLYYGMATMYSLWLFFMLYKLIAIICFYFGFKKLRHNNFATAM